MSINYEISRTDFCKMLADCFEIATRAANGQVIDTYDDYGTVETFRDGTKEECVAAAEYAVNVIAHEAITLLASSRAVEKVIGQDYIKGERFEDYMAYHTDFEIEFSDRFEAAKTATEIELDMKVEE